MPRKRFTFKRRSTGRRRSSGLRIPTAPRRWQTSDFFFESFFTQAGGSASEQLRVFNIVALHNALNLDANPAGAVIGRVMGNLAKKIGVGGLVFDYGLQHTGTYDGNFQAPGTDGGVMQHMTGLVYDELDTTNGALPEAGIPNFLNHWSPWTSGFPTAVMSSAGDNPDPQTAEIYRPMRILWRKADAFNAGANVVENADEFTYIVQNQRVDTTRGTVNRRLKLALDQNTGLFLFLATRNSPTDTTSTAQRRFHFWCQGQLYWRFLT